MYFQITKYTQSWLRFKMLLILSNLMSWLDCFFVIEVHYVGNLMILKVLNKLINFRFEQLLYVLIYIEVTN